MRFQSGDLFFETNCEPISKGCPRKSSNIFNKYWMLILYVVQKLNQSRFCLRVGRTTFQNVCYALTRVGIPTGFQFSKCNYGPYSNDIKDAVLILLNANHMFERQSGSVIETVVPSTFVLPDGEFTKAEIDLADRVIDLFSRIKSTEQAEVIATVLFSCDELSQTGVPTQQQIFNHVMEWKPHWRISKELDVRLAICELFIHRWLNVRQDCGLLDIDDYLF